MDPFLRRVLEQREREREAAIADADPCLFAPPKCTVCGKPVRQWEDHPERTACVRCVTPPTPPSEVRFCDICRKPLRRDNERGTHARCRALKGTR